VPGQPLPGQLLAIPFPRPAGLHGSKLLEHGLTDELNLSVHPVMIGSGQVLFREGQMQNLTFTGAKTFGTGVVS